MAEKAYDSACMRAELFGQEIPDRDEFMEKNRHLDAEENIEEHELEEVVLTEQLEDTKNGLTELNSILGVTQTKLNRLRGVCGSLTNILRFKFTNSKDNLSYSSAPSYVGQVPVDGDTVGPSKPTETAKSDINTALDDLEKMGEVEKTPLVSKETAKDLGQQTKMQLNKLDSLLDKAERAQASMAHQNKQMRSFLRGLSYHKKRHHSMPIFNRGEPDAADSTHYRKLVY